MEEKAAETASALEKVRGRFFDDVLFPRVVVRGIRSKLQLMESRGPARRPEQLYG